MLLKITRLNKHLQLSSAAVPYVDASRLIHTKEMCSGSEAGSYLRLIDFVYHSTLGLRVIKKEKKDRS